MTDKNESLASSVLLRSTCAADLPIFFEHQLDPEANRMAAFTAKDPSDKDAFDAHWAKILADDAITKRTIVHDEQVAGNVMCFDRQGKPEVCYWIGRAHWGKGIATAALTEFLQLVTMRPIYARVVKDNVGSVRVLEKCGFVIRAEESGFANARGAVVEELVFELG